MPLHIDAIAKVLINHGEMFHGGEPRPTAREWDSYLFTSVAVDQWCSIGVWDPRVADYFARNGMTPAYVKYMAKRMVEADAYTDGCPIYAACNGDLDPKRIVDAYRNS